jgi:hypothetical protein
MQPCRQVVTKLSSFLLVPALLGLVAVVDQHLHVDPAPVRRDQLVGGAVDVEEVLRHPDGRAPGRRVDRPVDVGDDPQLRGLGALGVVEHQVVLGGVGGRAGWTGRSDRGHQGQRADQGQHHSLHDNTSAAPGPPRCAGNAFYRLLVDEAGWPGHVHRQT